MNCCRCSVSPIHRLPGNSDQWSVVAKSPLGGRGSRRAERQLPLFRCGFSPTTVARAFLPGRLFARTKPRRGERLSVAQRFRGLITTKQRGVSVSSPSWCSVVVAWASARVVRRVQGPPPRRAVSVSYRVLLLDVTELVLGGPRESPPDRARLLPSRTLPPPDWRAVSVN